MVEIKCEENQKPKMKEPLKKKKKKTKLENTYLFNLLSSSIHAPNKRRTDSPEEVNTDLSKAPSSFCGIPMYTNTSATLQSASAFAISHQIGIQATEHTSRSLKKKEKEGFRLRNENEFRTRAHQRVLCLTRTFSSKFVLDGFAKASLTPIGDKFSPIPRIRNIVPSTAIPLTTLREPCKASSREQFVQINFTKACVTVT